MTVLGSSFYDSFCLLPGDENINQVPRMSEPKQFNSSEAFVISRHSINLEIKSEAEQFLSANP